MMIVTDGKEERVTGHWYGVDGSTQYEIKSTSGTYRPTNLRDAKKHGFVPSVTTVMSSASKPGLIEWQIKQAILAALTLPLRDGEPEADYLKRIMEDSKAQAKSAADRGTAIHNAVEDWFTYQKRDKFLNHVSACIDALKSTFGDVKWVSEESFSSRWGFGGKVDLHVKPCDLYPDGLVVDIKTKDFTDPSTVTAWDEHLWQLSAYREGLKIPHARAANIFISRDEPALTRIIEWDLKELEYGWLTFKSLLTFWKYRNKYFPGDSE